YTIEQPLVWGLCYMSGSIGGNCKSAQILTVGGFTFGRDKCQIGFHRVAAVNGRQNHIVALILTFWPGTCNKYSTFFCYIIDQNQGAIICFSAANSRIISPGKIDFV